MYNFKNIFMKYTSLLFSMLSLLLLSSCKEKSEMLTEGKYQVSSINFKDGTSYEKMSEYINSMKEFEVKGNSFIMSPDSSVMYKYIDGYLFVSTGEGEKQYECEIYKTGDEISYEIYLNEGDVKTVRIKNVSLF